MPVEFQNGKFSAYDGGRKSTKHTVLPFNTALDPTKAKLSDEHLIFDGLNLKREK